MVSILENNNYLLLDYIFTTLQAILMTMLQEKPELEVLGLQFYLLG